MSRHTTAVTHLMNEGVLAPADVYEARRRANKLGGTSVLVLDALVDGDGHYTNPATGETHASVTAVARTTGLGKDAIRAQFRLLADAGIIINTQRRQQNAIIWSLPYVVPGREQTSDDAQKVDDLGQSRREAVDEPSDLERVARQVSEAERRE